ncbi:MAG: tetratricopeptide repeat protein [Deltaproteobacteria bacterium]|nr:tetratricopeptide repeat protein [Deltaproteobacteria bacterium]
MENSNDIFGRILGNGPSQNTAFLVLRKMKDEGRSSEVITECLKALDFYPNDIRLRTLLAETYLEMGFIGQAERELDRITSDIKNLISAYKLQADIYTRQKRYEEASEALKRYLAHNPDDQEALDLLARIKPVEEKPFMEAPEVPEEAGPALEEEFEEEVKEEIITEPPEVPEEVVLAAEEEIEEEPVPIAPEPPEEITPVAEEEGEAFTDLATPTLAEIYYNQGQIHEAISTYERVILDNPEDRVSIERLEELKAQIAEKSEIKVTPEDALRARTEKMITVLEGWLERIQGSGHA